MSEINYFTNLPYLSFGSTKYTPEVETHRTNFQANEILRVHYKDKQFLFVIRNKGNKLKAGYADAKNIVKLIKTKYPNSKVADLNVCFPNTWSESKQTRLNKLLNEHVDNDNFEKYLYKFLVLLI